MSTTIILPGIMYGCKTWFFTLKEEHTLKVFAEKNIWTYEGE